MPRGMIKRLRWSPKQREIYHLLFTLGKTPDEVYGDGKQYGKDSIKDVVRAILRREHPPRYDPSEASMEALSAGNGHQPPPPDEKLDDEDAEPGDEGGADTDGDGRAHFEGDPDGTWRDKGGYLRVAATGRIMAGPNGTAPAEKSVKGNGHKPESSSTTTASATKVKDSVTTVIRGREAVIYSTYLQQAKQAAIDRFGFPPDGSDSEFIDWWLLASYAKYELYLNQYFAGPNAPPIRQEAA